VHCRGLTPQLQKGKIAVQNEIALVNQNNQAFVSSRELAVKFGKQHKDVLRIIHGYLDSENMNDFNERNFALNEHIQVGRAKRGRPRLADVLMTRDGFALLAMGLTGKRALEWKVKFLDAFNQMERVIVEKLPALQAENAALKAALEKKALPGRRANQIAVPVYHENLFGLVEEIRYEMRNKEKLDELMQAKAVVRHLRKQMKGMISKQDQLAERIDLLEGNKKAKLIKLIKDDPEKPL
jgi:Rha family phage regulatory protein